MPLVARLGKRDQLYNSQKNHWKCGWVGENHADTAESLSTLGTLYRRLGDRERGLYFSERALKVRQQIFGEAFGERHPAMAGMLSNLGLIYRDMDNLPRSMECVKQGLEIQREILGEKHPGTARLMQNVGVTFAFQGDHTSAIGYEVQALDIMREQLGRTHPDTVSLILSLSRSYGESGNTPKALSLAEETIGQLPKDHPEYKALFQRKIEVLSDVTGAGFRRQTQSRQAARRKRRRSPVEPVRLLCLS
mgnify:CR=1 FL=1